MPTLPTILSTRTRLVVITATLLTTLTLINLQITTKQRIITEGTTILLELAPRDPRSLLQGDYMALRYAMADEVAKAAEAAGVSDGRIVVELDENEVARLISIHDGEPLGNGQHLLQFRKRGESVRLASDAWFFEEGTGSQYRDAKYGEVRVSEDGAAVLTGLRTATYKQLGTI
ncbi:MAG: GDYXXLXY domain-containing protein [Woeseia sp.]